MKIDPSAEDAVNKALNALNEHFDSVQIFATLHHGADKSGEYSETTNLAYGRGNFFARFGQVRSWLIEEEARYAERGATNERDSHAT